MYKFLTLAVLASFNAGLAFAQQVAISDDGSAPAAGAALDVKSATKGFLLPRLSSTQRVLISNPAHGLMVYDNLQNRIYINSTTHGWRSLLNTEYWNGFTGVTYNTGRNVGVGISAPQERLHVADGHFKITTGSLTIARAAGLLQKISFDYTGASPNGFTQGLDFGVNNSGLRTGYVNFVASTTAGEDQLRLFPSVSGAHSLTVLGNGEFRFNGSNGSTLQLQDAGVSTGYVQVSGDDMRLGTNLGNTGGKLIMRTNSTDQVFVTPSGRMGIGELVPSQSLHVAGTMYVSGSVDVNAKTTADNIEFSGKLTKPSVGTASLTPLAYGSVYADGTPRSVTPNVTVTRISTGNYAIDGAGIDENCVILVTVADERHLGNGNSIATYANRAYIGIFYDSSTAPPPRRDSDFCFVIYKK